MSDEGFGAGLILGGLIIGVPLAIGSYMFSEASYNEGLKDRKLVWKGPFGILGRTEDGILVLIPSFERGKEVRLIIQGLEWRVYELEQSYKELRAAYTVSQGRIRTLEDEVENLRVQIEELRSEVSRRVPELNERLNNLIKRLELLTPKQRTAYST
jgi:hypothetical protein